MKQDMARKRYNLYYIYEEERLRTEMPKEAVDKIRKKIWTLKVKNTDTEENLEKIEKKLKESLYGKN